MFQGNKFEHFEIWEADGAVGSYNTTVHYIMPPQTVKEGKGDKYPEAEYFCMTTRLGEDIAEDPRESLKHQFAKNIVDLGADTPPAGSTALDAEMVEAPNIHTEVKSGVERAASTTDDDYQCVSAKPREN
jgi:hypothetical protein